MSAYSGGSEGKESAMWETQVQSLGWEDPPEKGVATPSIFLVQRIPLDREAWWAPKELDTTEQHFHFEPC